MKVLNVEDLFLWIVDILINHDLYFQMRYDATGRKGLSPLQKCTATIRILIYRSHVDEYVRIVECTTIECL